MKKSNEITPLQKVGLAALSENRQWLVAHAAEIAQYNAWACAREPYAQRVRHWRQSQTCKLAAADGAV